MSTSPKVKNTLQQLALPLIVSVGVLSVFYFGGDAYQAFGIAAVDSTKNFLKYVLGIVAFIAIGLLINRLVRLVIFDGIILSTTGFVVPKLLSQITSLLIFIVTVAACANIVFDQDLTVLWAASGVAGLVLGMALKELLQDVFAGIALNIDRSVAIGDFVQIHKAGDERIIGQLQEISWRSTQIEDTNGEVISFPNSKFSSFTITNFSASKSSGRSVSITIDGRVPTARAMRILQSATIDALTEVTGQYGSMPKIGIKAIKNDGVEYLINFEAEYQHISEATWKIQQAAILHLAKAGLKPAGHKTGEDAAADASFVAPDETRLAALISAAPIFKNILPEELAILVKHTRLRTFQADRVVVQSGEVGSEMYLVLEGLLFTTGGRKVAHRAPIPAILRPGDLFDAFATLLGNVHTTTVKTRTPSLICEINISGLQELFNSNPTALERIARNLMDLDSSSKMIWDEERFTAMTAQMHHLFPPTLAPSSNNLQ